MMSHSIITSCVYQAESLAANKDNKIVLRMLVKKGNEITTSKNQNGSLVLTMASKRLQIRNEINTRETWFDATLVYKV